MASEHQAIARRIKLARHVISGEVMRARCLFATGDAESAWQWLERHVGDNALEHDEWLLRSVYDLRHRVAKATGRLADALHAVERLLHIERREAVQRVQAQSRVLLRSPEVQTARDEAERLRAQAAELTEQAVAATNAALADALTGLANRLALDLRLQEWLRGEDGREAPFAAAMIDIDHFKHVNDSHGHEVVDAVVRAMARLLDASLREGDVAARNGGEEFVLLIRGSSLKAAADVCEHLRRAVEQHNWRDMLPDGDVTISVGLTAARADDEVSSLLRRADMAMYTEKLAGRNRLVVDEPRGRLRGRSALHPLSPSCVLRRPVCIRREGFPALMPLGRSRSRCSIMPCHHNRLRQAVRRSEHDCRRRCKSEPRLAIAVQELDLTLTPQHFVAPWKLPDIVDSILV